MNLRPYQQQLPYADVNPLTVNMMKRWVNIWERCYLPNNSGYEYYGARGICVCQEWMDFQAFYSFWGDPPFEDATIGDLDLEERRALRRVEGLGTELEDITEVEYRQVRLERVVLVGVWTQGSIESATRSMAELARLAETAGCTIVDALMQRRDAPDTATYIGSGKVKELRDIVMLNKADTVICDGELSPSQLRKLEDTVKVKVVDRTC